MDWNLFIRYDVLLALIVVIIDTMILVFFVRKRQELANEKENYNTPNRKLDLLINKPIADGKSILYSLSSALDNNNTKIINKNLEIINSIISYENKHNYKFSDITNEEIILIDTRTKFTKDVYSSTRIINRHKFELKYYLN
ncbi:MAG: hypothetical protein E7Z84_08180 [Methanosphaera stadtmanae]|nr:hypothetical protein [Methanosphaera stadtmanae]